MASGRCYSEAEPPSVLCDLTASSLSEETGGDADSGRDEANERRFFEPTDDPYRLRRDFPAPALGLSAAAGAGSHSESGGLGRAEASLPGLCGDLRQARGYRCSRCRGE